MLTSETAEEQNEGKLWTVSMCILTLFPNPCFAKKIMLIIWKTIELKGPLPVTFFLSIGIFFDNFNILCI